MKEQLKHFLEKIPILYLFVEKGYTYTLLKFRYLKYLLVGTKMMEKEWATRHLCERERERDDWDKENDNWIKGYQDSLEHPHRSFLIETISKFNPSSILEVGCNCGPNLYLLAKKFPDAKIIGIDINPMAVQKGNEWLVREGISNITLLEGKADELGQVQDKSFDVVFSDAVLIYIGPDKIKKVIAEMLSVSRQGLILLEWHSFEHRRKDKKNLGLCYLGCWKRDYVTLLKQLVPEEEICVTKITSDMWRNKNWEEVGAVIKVNKRQITNHPLVSVIIPVYNAEAYIKEAIDSLLAQTYKNIEIIVINDGSTDNTLNIIKKYSEQIKYISQANLGPSSARNAGIEIAKGDFIAYQDADDVSMPERIGREVDYLLNNPNMSMVFTGIKTISGNKIPKCHSEFLLLQYNYIPCGSVMHKKDILDSVGRWNEQVDWDLWIRIAEKFDIGYIKECLYEYRKQETGISSVRGRLKNRSIDLQMFKNRYKRKKEIWIAFKIKRISIECKLLRIIRFKNKRLEVIFWYGFQTLSNMIEKVIYIIERGLKK